MSNPGIDEIHAFSVLLRNRGIRLDRDQWVQLGVFLNELGLWNQKINLTGISSRRRIMEELLFDSILPTPFLPDEHTLLDIGSGAGFPAVPIKICKPRLKCQLIEPNKKKVRFLRQVIRLARLRDIRVIEGRMEQVGDALIPREYDVVTSRAFLPLPALLPLCAAHVAPGGCMATFLGNRADALVQETAEVMERHALVPFKRIAYPLPGKGTKREILILRRKA